MLIPVLALATAVMACSIEEVGRTAGEAYHEKCYKVDRPDYERAAAEVGQTPRTPKNPDLAIYEVCYYNDEDRVTSVRMSEGYRPEESEPATSQPAEVKPTKDLAPQNSPARIIPAGTYRGQFPWNANSISTLVENEITLVVSSSGEVSGEAQLKSNHTDSHNTSGGGKCTSYYESWTTYTLNGQVAGLDEKSITVGVARSEISDWSNCGRDINRREEACTCQASIRYDDELITITCGTGSDCGAYLTAKK